MWEEWQKTLAIVFCGGNLQHGLLTPLGPWLEEAPLDWQWWYSLMEERVYRQQAGRWQYYAVQWQGQ
jgi:hypothetical protein